MLYPKVSIIIPTYNAGKYIEQCIDSIFAQIYPSFEVIASYDINSTDDTLCILKTLSAKYPLIIDLGSKETSGSAGKVRNRGFLRATGEFVVFVDADDVVLPEYLSSMMNVFRNYPELNAVYCNYLRVNDNTIDSVKDKDEQRGDVYIISRDDVLPLYFKFAKNTDHLFAPPPMAWIWLIRRQFLLDNQIFFPEFYCGEDTVFTVKVIVCSDKFGV
ncbi:MAG: glycosyltransferase family A protein, partial [Bacilli bacterium]|nr:glycosyltransferase family A protein [Bacilli bacterium]